jgi:hypothetical protein
VHTRSGFRTVVRRPSVLLAEIAWRWAFGAAAWTLIIFAIRRILAHVDITQAELLIARRSDVVLIADACARILVQVLPQLVRECLVLAPAIAILWIAAATLGRAITLRALLSIDSSSGPPFFRPVLAEEGGDSEGPADLHFGRLLLLNCLRTTFMLVAIIAFFGGLLFAGLAFPSQNPALTIAIGLSLAALVGFSWSLVNWFLALAPIWIVRAGRTVLKSIADSLNLYRRDRPAYLGIASIFGVFRAAVLLGAIIAGVVAAQASPRAAVAGSVVIALVYFAVADFLYIVRLAAYMALDESSQLLTISSQPNSPEPQPISSPEM